MGALQPYRILDCTNEEGHFAGKLLAEMGAEVIKVEPPGGDPVRRRGPFVRDMPQPTRSLTWQANNTSKRSITLDVTRPAGKAILRRLVASADVLLVSGEPPLDDLPERLIVGVVTPFGPDGPYAQHTWTDTTMVAAAGFSFMLGDVDRPPVRMLPPQSHYQASMQLAIGVVIALFEREASGLGQRVDLSMQEATTYALDGPGVIASYWPLMGINVGRTGDSLNFGTVRWRVALRCADGYTANSGILGTNFERQRPLMEAEGALEDLDDPKWLTANSFAALPGQWLCTQADVDHVHDVTERWLMRHTKAEVMAMALQHDLTIYAVNDAADLFESEQLKARDYWRQLPVPGLERPVPFPGPAFRGTAEPYNIRGPAPLPGQDNVAIYGGELGLSAAERAALAAGGVI
jgi:benzylsuccinate CoA-transferase BbsE subunit